MRTCQIHGCTKPLKARGMCTAHYYRWAKYGDPHKSAFFPAPAGEPMAFLESLPMRGEGCVSWPYAKNNMGYGQVNAGGGKKVLAHRIACERANGPAPSPRHHASHSCGMGHEGCVAPWHLRWATAVENAADKVRHGTSPLRGEDHPQSRLSDAERAWAISMNGELSHAKIATALGVSQTLVSRMIRRAALLGTPRQDAERGAA